MEMTLSQRVTVVKAMALTLHTFLIAFNESNSLTFSGKLSEAQRAVCHVLDEHLGSTRAGHDVLTYIDQNMDSTGIIRV